MLSQKVKSALLIDNSPIDNFVNHKILEKYGVTTVVSYQNASEALSHLKETNNTYQLILIDIHMPFFNGFELVDKLNELELYKKHGSICLLSASLNPSHKIQSIEKNAKFIEKPLTLESLLLNL